MDLLITCVDHPCAANEVFLQAMMMICQRQNYYAVLQKRWDSLEIVPLSTNLLDNILLNVLQKKEVGRLFGSLQVDIDKTKELTGVAATC